MGMFDQLKGAGDLMKNLSPQQISELMKQAGESKKMMEEMVKKIIAEEIKERNLISRDEVVRLIEEEK